MGNTKTAKTAVLFVVVALVVSVGTAYSTAEAQDEKA